MIYERAYELVGKKKNIETCSFPENANHNEMKTALKKRFEEWKKTSQYLTNQLFVMKKKRNMGRHCKNAGAKP